MFEGVKTLDFVEGTKGRAARGHLAKDGESVRWQEPLALDGPVEGYLVSLEAHLRSVLREITETARAAADNWEVDKKREDWLEDYPAQLALLASQIQWTEETTRAFEDMESGSETAMRQYKLVNDDRIEKLIKRVQGDLTPNLRVKIITIITIDVHARDQIELYVTSKIMDSTDFKWMSQLRFYWQTTPEGAPLVSVTPEAQKTCAIKICDWVTLYMYEYVGNSGRLVITPLTDRCYITLTQALNLVLGGAPAGPAGTGKTETTKDGPRPRPRPADRRVQLQ
ncbi:unnamed protein product [Prorocentrum cordatum]|uniref:Dynein heavy chain hydrolytic ATP-binding dynein motor region domain-containing protein n=1 Tax=Prorocentrum cordatum TaxID=2364126 RepID=A0ABN9PG70_9DINO|nr:unnamed protein product [Polarella glacialis]